ncbi:MAG: hypothetical protein Q8908_05070, partial [Bacteroidota bacterium]|nr:hypothetical protein [Bacteroidota bacterium]
VKIKLTCGSRFWEVDYAAMDFSNNVPVTVDHLLAASAIDEKGNDVRKLIAAKDRKYLYQPAVGNNVILSFNATPVSGNHIATPFLHTRGYYEAIRNYKNKPDISYLKTFTKKGSFIKYTREKYIEYVSKDSIPNHAVPVQFK